MLGKDIGCFPVNYKLKFANYPGLLIFRINFIFPKFSFCRMYISIFLIFTLGTNYAFNLVDTSMLTQIYWNQIKFRNDKKNTHN